VNDALEHFRFHEAAHVVYHFFWGDFCDWYIEWVKPELVSEDRTKAAATWKNLFAAFESALRLLHPFMPFLTEELWHQLPQRAGARSIALDRFPEAHAERIDEQAERQMLYLQQLVNFARVTRADSKVDPKTKFSFSVGNVSKEYVDIIRNNLEAFKRLGGFGDVDFTPLSIAPDGTVYRTHEGDVGLRVEKGFTADAVLITAEVARLRKDIERLTKDVASKQQRLEDQIFRNRAPENIVKGLESTLEERQAELSKLKERLAQLEKNLGA